MSLINKMLRDLDERGAQAVEVPLPRRSARRAPVRTHFSENARSWLVSGALVLAAAAAGLIAWHWMAQRPAVAPEIASAPSAGALAANSPVRAGFSSDAPAAPSAASVDSVAAVNPKIEANAHVIAESAPGRDSPQPEPTMVPEPAVSPPRKPGASIIAPTLDTPLARPVKAVETRPSDTVPASKTPASVERRPLVASDEGTSGALERITRTTPQQVAEDEYRAALARSQQGLGPDAIAGLVRALESDPGHRGARQALVSLLIEAGRSEEAIRRLEEGLVVDPGQPALAMALARIQVQRGDLSGAEKSLRRTLPAASDRGDYNAFLAAVLQREGQHDQAAEHYRLALRNEPQQGVWWMGLAISLQAAKRPAEALEAYHRAKAAGLPSPELNAFVEQKLTQLR